MSNNLKITISDRDNASYTETNKNKKCLDCGKEISKYKYTRCQKCMGIYYSISFKGRKLTKKTIAKIIKNHAHLSKENHPNWQGGIPKCIDCKKLLKGYRQKRCWSCSQIERFKDPRNHPCYIDRISFENYPRIFNFFLKLKIRKRDNYKCQYCGMTQEEHFEKYNRDIEIHHIDYDKTNCKEDNLIALCKGCNINANFDRDYYYAYFIYIMENRK